MNKILKKSSQITSTRVLTRAGVDQKDIYESDDVDVYNNREYLLSEFADEIALVKKQAFDQAYVDARERIEEELNFKYLQRTEELERKFELKTQELDSLTRRMIELLKNAVERKRNLAASQESVAIYLALQIIYRLAGEKEVYQAAVAKLVKEEALEFGEKNLVKIRISPQDSGIVSLLPKELLDQIRILTDSGLQSGACEIEDGFSLIDVGVITQLDQLREALISKYREIDDVR